MNGANSIIPASTAIETFRDSGYKNTASALAELIDNSIEAKATEIQILTFEEQVQRSQRTTSQIQKIAVYDDGIGMSPEVLKICLQFGNGTKLKSRTGIGRFGIGLPNASVSQARRIDVYSWQGGVCHHTHLDVDDVKELNQQVVNPVIPCDFPKEYIKHLEGAIKETGTIIVWSKCDRLDMTRSKTLYNMMSQQLCRTFRHFLDSDDSYGQRVKICLIATGKDRTIMTLKANDPLYLMAPNNCPQADDKATNVAHNGVLSFDIRYNDKGDTAKVEIRFSVAKPETQKLGGSSPLGKHYGENTGISFVRACREIDFGTFGYFNDLEYRERWWGCEVRFEPVLDELFGVTNNKQAVRGINYLNEKEYRDTHGDEWGHLLNEDPKLKLRYELSKIFSKHHKSVMDDIILKRGEGKRGGSAVEKAESDKSTTIANKELAQVNVPTKSSEEGASKSADECKIEWEERLITEDPSLEKVEAEKVAEKKVGLAIEKGFDSWPGSQFFTVEVTGKTCVLVINRKHPFFTDLYEKLLEIGDDRYIDALDLTLMSYARMEDELYSRVDDLDKIRDVWGGYLKSFLIELKKTA